MKNLLVFTVLLTGCGTIDTVNVDAKKNAAGGETKAAPAERASDPGNPAAAADQGKPALPARDTVTARFELRNENPANQLFVSQNYCAGSHLRECWIRSGYLTSYADGSYDVAIELWDTYEAVPYKVESGRIDREKAFMLTDKAKLADDKSIDYKMLWASVVPEDRTVTIIYDWAEDGPGLQGDDKLDVFEFKPLSD